MIGIPPPSQVKRGTLRYLLLKHGLRRFLETGTYQGDTTAGMVRLVDRAVTIELGEELHCKAQARFANEPHVECWQGNSGDLLERLLADLDGPTLLWLDGHYSGGETALGPEVSPIWRELEQVRSDANVREHVLLIDDVRLFDGRDYPHLEDVLGWLGVHLPGHEVRVHNDMIFVEPRVDRAVLPEEVVSLAACYAAPCRVCHLDRYRLVMGPYFDRQAAWHAGYNESNCVSAVSVVSATSSGDRKLQVCNALGIAIRNQLRSVYLPGFDCLEAAVHELPVGVRLINLPGVMFDDEEVILTGDFLDLDSLVGFGSREILDHAVLSQVVPWIRSGSEGVRWDDPGHSEITKKILSNESH